MWEYKKFTVNDTDLVTATAAPKGIVSILK